MTKLRLEGWEAIEAYISDGGFICQKQENGMGEDPSIVMMLPTDVPTIVDWLHQLVADVREEETEAARN